MKIVKTAQFNQQFIASQLDEAVLDIILSEVKDVDLAHMVLERLSGQTKELSGHLLIQIEHVLGR